MTYLNYYEDTWNGYLPSRTCSHCETRIVTIDESGACLRCFTKLQKVAYLKKVPFKRIPELDRDLLEGVTLRKMAHKHSAPYIEIKKYFELLRVNLDIPITNKESDRSKLVVALWKNLHGIK